MDRRAGMRARRWTRLSPEGARELHLNLADYRSLYVGSRSAEDGTLTAEHLLYGMIVMSRLMPFV